MGHLGSRVSALLDGQLSPEESERAWEHVHACHHCRDLVEHEGWVKTRLAGLSFDDASAPDHLKGFLRGGPHWAPRADGCHHPSQGRSRRNTGLVALGGGAVGAAVMGVLALGVAPGGDAPANDRRAPVTNLVRPSETPRTTPSPSLTTSPRPSASPSRGQRPR